MFEWILNRKKLSCMNIWAFFFLRFFFFSFVQNVDKKPNYWSVIEKVSDFYPPCCRSVLDLNLNRRHLKRIRSVGKSAVGQTPNLKKTTVRFFIFANFKFQCCLFLFCQLKPQSWFIPTSVFLFVSLQNQTFSGMFVSSGGSSANNFRII